MIFNIYLLELNKIMKRIRYIFFFIFSLIQSILLAQYDFTAVQTEGCDSLTTDFFLSTTNGVSSALWNFNNGLTSNSVNPDNILFDSTGVYSVEVIINNTDTITKARYIRVFPTPRARIFHTDTATYGSFKILLRTPPQMIDTIDYFYRWDFGDGESGLGPIQIHKYESAGAYFVQMEVYDRHGCINAASDSIFVEDRFEVQNVFSPNDDGYNDLFNIQTNGTSVYELKIFSRTGTLIYKTEAPVIIWDGTNNSGVKVSPGIYYYIIQELSGSRSRNQTGFVYLFY